MIQTGLGFTLLTTVFFLFPPELPVTGTNMNYAIAVFGFIRMSSTSQMTGPHTNKQ